MERNSMNFGSGIAPLEERKKLRRERAAENAENGKGFNHAEFLSDVAAAETNGERGLARQIARGGLAGVSVDNDTADTLAAAIEGGARGKSAHESVTVDAAAGGAGGKAPEGSWGQQGSAPAQRTGRAQRKNV